MKVTVTVMKDVEIEVNDRWENWDMASFEKNQKVFRNFQQEIQQQINLPFCHNWEADFKNGAIYEVWADNGNIVLYE